MCWNMHTCAQETHAISSSGCCAVAMANTCLASSYCCSLQAGNTLVLIVQLFGPMSCVVVAVTFTSKLDLPKCVHNQSKSKTAPVPSRCAAAPQVQTARAMLTRDTQSWLRNAKYLASRAA